MKPSQFGKFILLEKIAAGGMAEVFLAKSSSSEGLSKFIAVKRILPQFSSNDEFIEMFKAEAKIALNLTHSNVVSINEFGEHSKQYYLAMDYVQGRNLRQLVNRLKKRKIKLEIEHIVYIVNEIAKGLDYAHRCVDKANGRSLNIIHRDISPQNVMLSFEGEIKLVDFGIAKAESKIETTRAGTLKGKFGYMSPEQAEGLELDLRTDIFSLGIILWELLATDRLFVANNEINTIRKIRDCHIPELHKIDPKIHQDLEIITNKALSRDRSLRYQSTADLQRDLNKFLNRHYPDYSIQDFAQFMKQTYTTEIIEMRERLIEFSKIQFDPQTGEEKTSISDHTRTITKTNEHLGSKSGPQNFSTNDASADIGELDFQEAGKAIPVPIKSHRKALQNTTSSFTQSPMTGSQYRSPLTATYTTGGMQKNSRSYKGTGIVLGLLLISYLILSTQPHLSNHLLVFIGLSTTESRTVEQVSKTKVHSVKALQPPPKKKLYSFMLKSKPSGAQIYINNQNTKLFTQGRLLLEPNIEYTITLKKRGYLDYTTRLIAKQNGQMFAATLQKSYSAYLSINVIPGNADIYINGSKLQERPPIQRYAVPANKTLKIKAYNPITKSQDYKEIRLKADTHKTINLYLKKKSAKKSNRRTRRPTRKN